MKNSIKTSVLVSAVFALAMSALAALMVAS
jgi:hypothetical protein